MGYESRIYKIFDTQISWFDAEAYCESVGGHLVTITSAEEQTFVETYMSANSFTKHAWIGAYTDGTNWRWVTGEIFDYSNWSGSQPDCLNNTQFFAILNFEKIGKWDDITPLVSPQYFICEWEAE